MSNNGGVRIYLRECVIANNKSPIQDCVFTWTIILNLLTKLLLGSNLSQFCVIARNNVLVFHENLFEIRSSRGLKVVITKGKIFFIYIYISTN